MQNWTEGPGCETRHRKEIIGIRSGKERLNLTLFTEDMVTHVRNVQDTSDSIKKRSQEEKEGRCLLPIRRALQSVVR